MNAGSLWLSQLTSKLLHSAVLKKEHNKKVGNIINLVILGNTRILPTCLSPQFTSSTCINIAHSSFFSFLFSSFIFSWFLPYFSCLTCLSCSLTKGTTSANFILHGWSTFHTSQERNLNNTARWSKEKAGHGSHSSPFTTIPCSCTHVCNERGMKYLSYCPAFQLYVQPIIIP